jgi:hypothetical protein
MHKLDQCRACLAPAPYLFLPLGMHAPAQMLIRPDEMDKPQPSFPLNTQVCLECGLIQVTGAGGACQRRADRRHRIQ